MKWMRYLFIAVAMLLVLIAALLAYAYWETRIKVPEDYVAPFSYSKEEVLDPFVMRREVYGDAKIFDQPRIQFVWRGPKRGRPEIWSVKIDGSDLRLAADAELLYQGDTNIGSSVTFGPSRSPDNRYILVNMNNRTTGRIAIHIIDLKNKTNKIIEHDGEVFGLKYPWVADSKSFFYIEYHKNKLSRYYLDTGKIEPIRDSSFGLQYVQQTAEIITEIFDDDFVQWDFKGNELRRVSLGERVHGTDHYVSPDGSYFIYQGSKGAFMVPMDNFNGAEKLPPKRGSTMTWGGKAIIKVGISIYYYDTKTKKETIVFEKYGGGQYNDEVGFQMRRFSLFNEANTHGQ